MGNRKGEDLIVELETLEHSAGCVTGRDEFRDFWIDFIDLIYIVFPFPPIFIWPAFLQTKVRYIIVLL